MTSSPPAIDRAVPPAFPFRHSAFFGVFLTASALPAHAVATVPFSLMHTAGHDVAGREYLVIAASGYKRDSTRGGDFLVAYALPR